MESAVYRKMVMAEKKNEALAPPSLDLIYPVVDEKEREMWTQWLPTSFVYVRTSRYALQTKLTDLRAPQDVFEEFSFAYRMNLFEAYEVRTPVRRDARDPLLMGRANGIWYRLGLWGESLLPLEEITALVQQSFVIRSRAVKRRVLLGLGGALSCLALVWNPLLRQEHIATGFLLTLLIFFLPMLMYTPESVQHDFLDKYRC